MPDLADRILVIDSDDNERGRLLDYLMSKGYLVDTASSLEEAKLLADKHSPDLIFADVANTQIQHLPLQNNDATQPTPFVIVSEVAKAGDVVACLRAGASDFILKPVSDYASVDNVMHRILDKVRLAKLNLQLHQELEEGNKKLRQGIQELREDQKAGLQVQIRMLPEQKRTIHDYHFDHLIKPSLMLSGDFLDYFKLDKNRAVYYFADVSGHGASSAFVTVLLKNLTMRLKRNMKRGSSDELSSPDWFLQRMNKELIASGLGKHVTVFAAILDKNSGEMSYSVGGHLPMPILVTEHGSEYLSGKGMAVGLFEEPTFNVHKMKLPENFKIMVFSDGILEVIAGETLKDKEKLLLDVVSRERGDIESLLSSLGLDDVDELPDDIAVLSVSNANYANC